MKVYYKPRLGKAILMTMEMDDGKDETFEFYYTLIEKRAKKIEIDVELIKQHAAAVFLELLMEKRRKQNLNSLSINCQAIDRSII